MESGRGDRACKKKMHVELVNPNDNKNCNSGDDHEMWWRKCWRDGRRNWKKIDDGQVEEKEKGEKDSNYDENDETEEASS